MSHRILIVEDEPEMRVLLRDNFEFEGYEVISVESGEQAVATVQSERPELVVLDLMLPGMSGYEVCRKLRLKGIDVPIIIITARNTELDRIAGFELGADDYVGKPFSVRELVARVRARLRRHQSVASEANEFAFGDIVVDFTKQLVWRGPHRLEFSAREFELIRYFIEHRGEVLTRERLLKDVWGFSEAMQTRTVDNFVAKLRRKIEVDDEHPQYILTIHGTGYRFLPPI
jgi:DNA-binding response OmpR family regulator